MADENAAESIISNLLELAPNLSWLQKREMLVHLKSKNLWVSVNVSQVQNVTMSLEN